MRHVARPDQFPNRCAVLPQVGHDHPKGFIDTGNELPIGPRDPHVYVSVQAVEELARVIGLPTRQEIEVLESLVASLGETIETQDQELNDLREFERSARYTVEHFGERVRRKPGPKSKAEKVTA